jgi:3-oxosteroid 1-dehydrogenase
MIENWDESCDVLVVGSGAGAMVAGIAAAKAGLKALVIEKSEYFGGTSATSGSGTWIVASHYAAAIGQQDSEEEGFRYIKALAGNVPEDRIRAYVREGRRMLAWLARNTRVEYRAVGYTDYHAELPGGKMGYRTHEAMPIKAQELGDSFRWLRHSHPTTQLFGRMPWTMYESAPMITRGKGWKRAMFKVVSRYMLDVRQRLRSPRARYMTFGNALLTRLKLSLDDAGAELRRETALVSLVQEEGRVTGAVVRQQGVEKRIRATHGIVLAAGGFERSAAHRRRYIPGSPDPAWTASQAPNTGDALDAAIAIGAATSHLDAAWWSPSIVVPGEDRARPLHAERALPGTIIVNGKGRRYLNEAASYHIVGRQMIERNSAEAPSIPSFILFDAEYRRKYPMGPVMPVGGDLILSKAVRSILFKASDWRTLAGKIGVPADELEATMARYNANAARGEDPDFHRGRDPYDRYYGDPKRKPNPNLKPLDTPPYYAMRIHPGDIGTCGGLVTDAEARVLDENGRPIEELYATGNITASVMGYSYPGAGATLGPAMTFGFIAAQHIASRAGKTLPS